MEVEEVEFLVVAFPADPFQHHHVQGVRIAHGAIEPQGFRPCRIEPGRGMRIAAGEKRHVVTQRDEFLCQPVNHTFSAAIQFRRNSLRQRSNLRDAHLITSCHIHVVMRFRKPSIAPASLLQGTFL